MVDQAKGDGATLFVACDNGHVDADAAAAGQRRGGRSAAALGVALHRGLGPRRTPRRRRWRGLLGKGAAVDRAAEDEVGRHFGVRVIVGSVTRDPSNRRLLLANGADVDQATKDGRRRWQKSAISTTRPSSRSSRRIVVKPAIGRTSGLHPLILREGHAGVRCSQARPARGGRRPSTSSRAARRGIVVRYTRQRG